MTSFIQAPFWARGAASRVGSPHCAWQFLDVGGVTEPITLGDAKAWLRVTVPDDDAQITRLIRAARVTCENRTHRALAPHVCDVFYDRVGPAQWLTLPFAPVSAVTSITMTDLSNVATVIDPATYLVDLASEPARVGLPLGQFWPWPLRAFQAVAVRLALGYVEAPEDLRHAMLLLVAHYYESRNAVEIGHITAVLPLGVDELLAPYELVTIV